MVFIRKPSQRLSDSPWWRGQRTPPGWSGTDDIDWTLVLPRLTVNPVKHLLDIIYRASDSTTWSSSYCSKTFYSFKILNLTWMFYLVSKDSRCIDKLYHIEQISGNVEHLISAFLRSLSDVSVLPETLFSLHLQRCSQLKCVRVWRKKTAVKEMSLCERRWRMAAGWDASTNDAFMIRSSMWSPLENVSSLNPLIKQRLDPTNQTPSDSSMFSKVYYIISVNLTHSHTFSSLADLKWRQELSALSQA